MDYTMETSLRTSAKGELAKYCSEDRMSVLKM